MGNLSPEARREMITKKAYELFVSRGGEPGHEVEDWLTAEQLVDRELQKSQSQASQPQAAPTQTAQPKTTPPPKQQTPTPIRPNKVAGYKKPR